MVAKKPNYTLSQAQFEMAALRQQLSTPNMNPELIANQASPPNVPGMGLIRFAINSYQKYFSSNDGNAYVTGVSTVHHSGGQVVNSATPAAISGLSFNVGVGAYVCESWLQLTADSSSFLGYVYLAGTATLSTSPPFRAFVTTDGNGVATTFKIQTTLGTNTNINFGLSSGVQYINVIRAAFTVTTAGTVVVNGATSGGDGYTTGAQGIFRIWPDT